MAGPAFVVGCWGFGPGNLTTSIQAGSGFGYDLVWVVVAATVLMLCLADMSVRIGIQSPVSLLTAVKQKLGTWVGYLAGGMIAMAVAKGGGPARAGADPHLGDLLSTLTAVWYGGYFLFMREARRSMGAVAVMFWSSLVSAPLLLVAALLLREPLLPAGTLGWVDPTRGVRGTVMINTLPPRVPLSDDIGAALLRDAGASR